MDSLSCLCEGQLESIKPFFSKSRCETGGGPQGGQRQQPPARYRLRWVDAPATYGPHTTLSNRCRCWSDNGGFERIFSELARSDGTETETVLMVDATDGKAHPTASSLNKGAPPHA